MRRVRLAVTPCVIVVTPTVVVVTPTVIVVTPFVIVVTPIHRNYCFAGSKKLNSIKI